MGRFVSSLADLQFDEDIHTYIFVLHEGWDDENVKNIETNFKKLAKKIGKNALIVEGLDEQLWVAEVGEKYLGDHFDRYLQLIPALLITNAHPDELKPDSMRIIISLREVSRQFGDWSQFFALLTQFAKRENVSAFLGKIQKEEDAFDVANKIFNFRPGMLGISININEIAAWFRRSNKQDRLNILPNK